MARPTILFKLGDPEVARRRALYGPEGEAPSYTADAARHRAVYGQSRDALVPTLTDTGELRRRALEGDYPAWPEPPGPHQRGGA